jgi:hypothetical protein
VNTPYNPKEHLPLLKAVAPGLRVQPADAWGNSSSNAHWAAIEVPIAQQHAFFYECARLNIYRAWDTAYPGYVCNKLCRYVRDDPTALRMDAQIRQVHGTAGGLG